MCSSLLQYATVGLPQAAAAAPRVSGPWGMLDSKRFNYQHVESYTLSLPASNATCASRITFEQDGTLSIQVRLGPSRGSHGPESP